HGQCGACTVYANGPRVNSCLSLALMLGVRTFDLISRQNFFNGSYRKEHLQFIGWQRHKTEALVVTLRFDVLAIYEEPNAACRFENFHELSHGSDQQYPSNHLPLKWLCHGQPADPDSRHISGKPSGLLRCQFFRLQLTDIE